MILELANTVRDLLLRQRTFCPICRDTGQMRASRTFQRCPECRTRSDEVTVSAEDACAALQTKNIALVRNFIRATARQRIYDWAESKFVTSRDPGNNLLIYISDKRGDNQSTDIWLIRAVLNPRIVKIASDYFEHVAGTRDFLLPFNNLLIRQFSRTDSNRDLLVPYHQDAAGLPEGFHMINCWTLLYPEECGTVSPGLDFCPAPLHSRIARSVRPTSKHYKGFEVDNTALRSLSGEYGNITPSVRLGDILFFNEFALHRTAVGGDMNKPRVSAEIRLVAANERAKEECDRTGAAYAHVSGTTITWPATWTLRNGMIAPVEMQSADII